MSIDIYREERPWGAFEQFTNNIPSTVKLLRVHAHQAFSLQYHRHREEFWRVLSGHPLVTVGDQTVEAAPGSEFFIPKEAVHRIEAQDDSVLVLEIAFGTFDEQDIVRLEDRYGRD